MEQSDGGVLLRAEGLSKLFPASSGPFVRSTRFVHAVDGISFDISVGDSLALVGESGSGKTTTAKLVAKLLEPTGGRLLLRDDGAEVDIAHLQGRRLHGFRRRVQMIFQDPYESMNPRRTIYDTVAEPLAVQRMGNIRERREKVAAQLDLVGLSPPAAFLFRFPHELSGGQRQRVAIARALVLEPSLIVADEPTSMLDVSTRSSIINLMLEVAGEFAISYLYISHDLAVARYMCGRIAVMYLGKIVESAATEELLANPLHPYTQALIAAVPTPDPRARRAEVKITGAIPSPVDPIARCRFYDRCPLAGEICRTNDHPPLRDAGGGHLVACHKV